MCTEVNISDLKGVIFISFRMKLDETLKNETDNDMPCYNENGMFVPEMGAVVIRKLCNILKMVIVVVTSGVRCKIKCISSFFSSGKNTNQYRYNFG